jgi:perosamine synthetase
MKSVLAVDGGVPVRGRMLPYSRHWIDEADIESVVQVLRGDWLTTGPKIREFEQAFAGVVGAAEAVAVSSGTAALHGAAHALRLGPGDEVIVPALTFAASANCVLYQGATPVFADVEPDTLLIDPRDAEAKITERTRAIIAVDYAGQPCDYAALRRLTERHGLALIADACHSLGASWQDRPVGTLGDLNVFSLHAVKAMTAGEGGVVTSGDALSAQRIRCFRNHGVTSDHFQRERAGSWFYEMGDLGYNYRLSDLQCALGLAQLTKLPAWVARRRAIAKRYDRAIASMAGVEPLRLRADVQPAYHLYVIRLDAALLNADRARIFTALRAEGIGVNVHYVPVHLHPYYRRRFGTGPGLCPKAEAAYETILSLPMFPAMTDADAEDVVQALWKVVNAYAVRTGTAAFTAAR